MDKVIEIIRKNNKLTVHMDNVTPVEVLGLLKHIVIDLAKDVKEQRGVGACGQFLEIVGDNFSAKSLDFLVNNIDREDFKKRAIEFVKGDDVFDPDEYLKELEKKLADRAK